MSFSNKSKIIKIMSDQLNKNKDDVIDLKFERQSMKKGLNPGIGLRMTSQRCKLVRPNSNTCPQSYDVSYKLSAQERRQNKLLSERHHGWKASLSSK